MADEPMSAEEIEATVAAIVRGELKIGGGMSDQGWVIQRVGEVLWYSSWREDPEGAREGEDRPASADELRWSLRRYGRKIIRRR